MTARSVFHESNTARTARSICSRGSCGNSRPASLTTTSLYVSTSWRMSSASRSRSSVVSFGVLGRVERVVEVLARDSEHGLAEHLDEPAVGVEGEPLVARLRRQAAHRLVVETDVEDRLHHSGHRELGARAHRHQQRVVGLAQLLAHGVLQGSEVLRYLCVQLPRLASALQVRLARLGRDREARRHRQPQIRHLREVRALTPQQVLHVLVAFVEVVDVLGHGSLRQL